MSVASMETGQDQLMLNLPLLTVDKPYHILCLGAHCDDIEIGCGGTILSLINRYSNLSITWIVFTSSEKRKQEATLGAQKFTKGADNLNLRIYGLRDGFLPYSGLEVKEIFEEVKNEIDTPDLIFTHYRNDLHQDHRKINELTWNTFRNHLILEYEIPKWDGDLGVPNAYWSLSKDICEQKIRLLQEVYNSQLNKTWFTDDLFWSLMRLRGMECHSDSRFAEAFYTRKLLLS